MSKKVLKYFFIRFSILITPLLLLVLILIYLPVPRLGEHHGDTGLGFAIMGGTWLLVFFIFTIVEMLKKIISKDKIWKANLVLIIIITLPLVTYLFLMGILN